MSHPIYKLTDFDLLTDDQISQIIRYFNHPSSDNNRLAAIILSYNAKILSPDDRRYVAHPYFIPFYLGDIDSYLKNVELSIDGTQHSLDKIKQGLDYLFSIPTQVVCVKVADIRPQYQDLSKWMEDPNNVYIGRRGIVFINRVRYPPENSIWHNPYKIKKGGALGSVIQQYRHYIIQKLKSGEIPRSELEKLRGKTLGCWCKTKGDITVPCHGDVLVELLNHPEIIDNQ